MALFDAADGEDDDEIPKPIQRELGSSSTTQPFVAHSPSGYQPFAPLYTFAADIPKRRTTGYQRDQQRASWHSLLGMRERCSLNLRNGIFGLRFAPILTWWYFQSSRVTSFPLSVGFIWNGASLTVGRYHISRWLSTFWKCVKFTCSTAVLRYCSIHC